MVDLDGALPSRLAALAEAVPVEPRRSAADVRAGGVVLGRTSRRVAPTTLMAMLAIGATGVLIAGVLRVGPFGPAASSSAAPTSDSTAVSPEFPLQSPTDGPQVGRDSEGPYSVEIRSGRRVYRESEPIDITAVFTYTGDKSVSVSADAFFPLSFGIREPVHGLTIFADRAVPMIWRPGCRSVVFQPGDERTSKFTVTGFGPSPPNEEQQAFLADPELHLPPGTWHFVVESSVMGVGPCADATGAHAASRSPDATLSAKIEIEVATTPGPPQPTPFLNNPVYGGDDIGDFTLQLQAGHATYVAGAPIDVSAWYAFASGVGNTITVSHFVPQMEFSISQVDDAAQLIRYVLYDSACQELTLVDGREVHVAIADGNVTTIRAVSWPPSTADALKEGILQLPVGRWRITAVVQMSIGPCGAPGEFRQLHASIEIDVVGPDEAAIDLATGPVPTLPNGTKGCLMALGSGILALNPRTGLGFADESGKVITDVVWPDGYSARYQDGLAILIDDSGHIVATVRDEMSLGGGYGDDNVFHVCGAGMVGDAESPQSSLASDGGFELRLAASNPTFQVGAPVEVEWSLVNAGNAASMHVLAVSPLVAFSAREVGGSRHVEADVVGSCAEFGSWSQGSPVRGYFEQSGPSSNWSDPAFVHGFGQDRDVYLPTGTWVLSATTQMLDDLCEVVISDLRADITITILP